MEKQIDNLYGLIGYPLSHSFSKKYFSEKFKKEGLANCAYKLFEIPVIDRLQEVLKDNGNLRGLNVTIPYKEKVLPYIDELDESALSVGAVNVIKVNAGGELIGYNSDYYGFKASLENWIPNRHIKALVLGTGGASKAVVAALKSLNIDLAMVSRNKSEGIYSYEELLDNPKMLKEHKLIVNTTPLGMSPKVENYPQLDYGSIGDGHFLYDLVYNPEHTVFMKKGEANGAIAKNGLEMLHLQAEKSWEIWNKDT